MDTLASNTSDNIQQSNDNSNISFSDGGLNSSMDSGNYSADEQVIRQRGSHLSKSNTIGDKLKQKQQLQQLQQQQQQLLRPRHLNQTKETKQLSLKRKSLLRTPVKKRLRRHVVLLSKMRQSNNCRSG